MYVIIKRSKIHKRQLLDCTIYTIFIFSISFQSFSCILFSKLKRYELNYYISFPFIKQQSIVYECSCMKLKTYQFNSLFAYIALCHKVHNHFSFNSFGCSILFFVFFVHLLFLIRYTSFVCLPNGNLIPSKMCLCVLSALRAYKIKLG